MAFVPFDGELDKEPAATQPTSFKPFEGELDTPASTKLDEAGRKSSGIAQAAMSTVAGLPSQIVGGVGALGGMAYQGAKNVATGNYDVSPLETGNKVLEKTMKFNFGAGEFKPWTATGEKYTENVGKVMEKPAEWAADATAALGGNDLAQTNAKVAVNTLMNFLPIPVGVKGMKGSHTTWNKLRDGKSVTSAEVQGGVDALIANKQAAKAAEVAPQVAEQAAVQGPTLPNRTAPGNARTSVQNPAAAAMNPVERMAQELGAGNEPAAPQGRSPMSAMAEDLTSPANAATRAADDAIAARQAAMEQQVKTQAGLDFNAAERARQEAAPTGAAEAQRSQRIADAEANATAQPDHGAILQAEMDRLAAESDKMQNMHQVEIDDTQHVLPDSGQLYADQYGAAQGVGRVDENGMPIRADRSLEAQQLENPLQRNLWGDELADSGLTGKDVPLTQALDKLPDTIFKGDLRDQALAMLGDQRAMSNMKQRGVASEDLAKALAAGTRWFTASPEHGRTKGYTLEEQAARANANEQRYGPGQYIAENRDFSSVYGGPEGRMYQVGNEQAPPFQKPFDINKPGNQKTYDTIVKMKGSKAEANKTLAAAGYDAVTFTSPRGDKLANIFNEAPLTDVGPARETAKQVALDDLKLVEYEPGQDRTGLYKRQGGVIKVDGEAAPALNVLKGIAAFKNNMRNIIPEKLTPEQFVEKYTGAKDIVQNAAQVVANQFTKGGTYLAERFDNPLYSRAVNEFQGAEGRAKAAYNEFVNEDYAPKARALSKQEFTDTWYALKKFEQAGVRPSPDELAAANLNAKQRALIDSHWNMMDNIFPKINETMQRMGMDPISPEAAYVATKATGQFRAPVYKDGKIVGYVGSETRRGLQADLKKYLALDAGYTAGPETVMNSKGRSGLAESMQDTLNWLKNNDPDVAQFIEHTKGLMDSAAFNYRGAKTHTMSKSGLEGTPGNKPWLDDYKNAKEGFEAQTAYAKRMFEWAEKAKAMEAMKPLLAEDVLPNMPNAKRLTQEYIDSSMGKNPTLVGSRVDDVFSAMNTASGGQTKKIGMLGNAARSFAYAKFLKLDLGNLVAQLAQMPAALPEMAAFLNARGSGGNLLTALPKIFLKDEINKGALQYARDNHVYAPDLVGHSDSVRAGAGHVWDVVTNAPIAKIESGTRQAMYLALTRKMYEGGLKPEDGLYATAARLTDMAMGNYSRAEAPKIYQQMGEAGTMPYTLSTFKHNELSRFALLAREIGNSHDARPLLTAMAAQVAKAGIFGTIFYKEAEFAIEQITKAMGKPFNLTKWMLDNADKKLVGPVTVKDLSYGLPGQAGVDLTTRMGMGEIVPSGPDVIMPGASAVVQGAKDIGDMVTDPSVYNAKKAMVDILPGGRHMEGFMFDKPIAGSENTLGINRNKASATVERTPTESRMKKFGFTSVNENATKAQEYLGDRQTAFYKDKRDSAVLGMRKNFLEHGEVGQEYVDKFFKNEGKESELRTELTKMVQDQSIPIDKRNIIRDFLRNRPGTISRRFNGQ